MNCPTLMMISLRTLSACTMNPRHFSMFQIVLQQILDSRTFSTCKEIGECLDVLENIKQLQDITLESIEEKFILSMTEYHQAVMFKAYSNNENMDKHHCNMTSLAILSAYASYLCWLSHSSNDLDFLFKTFYCLDYALFVTNGIPFYSEIQKIIQALEKNLYFPASVHQSHSTPLVPKLYDSIEFISDAKARQSPFHFPNLVRNWNAIHEWSLPSFFKTFFGHRTVPVELGSDVLSKDFNIKLMRFSEFIEVYCNQNNSTKTAYLAQHDLFSHIPALREFVDIPEIVIAFKESLVGEGYPNSKILINCWISGCKGTVTPFHFDPYFNFFAQVTGTKTIYLMTPEDGLQCLYPMQSSSGYNSNFTGISMDDLDYLLEAKRNNNSWPLFQLEKIRKIILNPGDLVYLPPKWWHHVKSDGYSVSVSFWIKSK